MFNEQKATELAAHFLSWSGGQMKFIKLLKLIYLADRAALDKEGHSLSTDCWVSMKHGPVPSQTYNLITEEVNPADHPIWNQYIEGRDNYCVGLRDERVELKQLSPSERNIAQEVWDQYGQLSIWDQGGLIDFTHTLPEWKDPSSEGSGSSPIPLERILMALNKNNDEIQAIQDLEQNDAWLDSILS